MQKINVTLTDYIPPELLAKMESMGIDTKKLHLKNEEGTKPVTSLSEP